MLLSWRPFRLRDTTALSNLYAKVEFINPTGDFRTAEELLRMVRGGGFDLSATMTAWGDGELLAYAALQKRDGAETTCEVSLEMLVHPEWRTNEISVHLSRWLLAMGSQVQARSFPKTELQIYASVRHHQTWLARLLQQVGFCPERVFFDMYLTLKDRTSTRPLNGIYSLNPFVSNLDEKVRLACNEAFSNHWGTTPWSAQTWRTEVTQSGDFLPELSFLLVSPETSDVVAFVLTSHYADESSATGKKGLYIDFVGTRTEVRGKGLATSLLGHTLAAAATLGFDEARLVVDSDRTHDAVGLYERQGFNVAGRFTSLVLVLPSMAAR